MACLTNKPWEIVAAAVPESIYAAKGMIGPEERRCYYWLARHCLSGRGCIVDAGAFLGSSTFCFAAGAADAGRRDFEGRPLIHAFDYFEVVDKYVGDAISRDFHAIGQGESYLDIFLAQTAPYVDLIETHPGDFLDSRWTGEPIEILFIDIAKSDALNAHAVGELFPALIPGRSVLIHQDYYHCWHPGIHISMQFFKEDFELLDEHVKYQSRLWRLSRPIAREKIDCIRNGGLTATECMRLLDQLVEESSPGSRPMNEVVRLWQRCRDRDLDAAAADLKRLRETYDIDERCELWAVQARDIREYLVHRGVDVR